MLKTIKQFYIYFLLAGVAFVFSACSQSTSPTSNSSNSPASSTQPNANSTSGTSTTTEATQGSTTTSESTQGTSNTTESTQGSNTSSQFSPTTFNDVKNVYFNFDRSNLTSDAVNYIEIQLPFIQKYISGGNGRIITISGYADERGSIEYNLALGQRRASSVVNYLINAGISQSNIKVVSYGEGHPFAQFSSTSTSARTRSCVWGMNRRVLTTLGTTVMNRSSIQFDSNVAENDRTSPLFIALHSVDQCSVYIK